MKNAVTNAAGATEPLGLLLTSASDTTLANHFIRFASNDHVTLEWRPQLTIEMSNRPGPRVNPGTAPSAVVGANVALNGSVTDATSSAWSLVSGPGQVWFVNATTLKFSAPGVYLLRLSAVNGNGETSRTLSVTVTGTALTPIEIWRQSNFGNHTNTGTAADTFDANGDGELNLMEFATGQNPNAATTRPATLVKNGAILEFTYTKNNAATDVTFIVEWSDTLAAGSWSNGGVTEQSLGGNTVKATIPAGSGSKRFVRLRVTQP